MDTIPNLHSFLDAMTEKYNCPDFIKNDPVSIPHLFNRKQDIEIMGLWAALLAWGQRVTIINKCKTLIELMDNAPYDFIINHKESDLRKFTSFKHRTFNATDTLYFIHFFKIYYRQYDTLETGFSQFIQPGDVNIEKGLIGFHYLFFNISSLFGEEPVFSQRTIKHLPTPERKSACKRINMFLRWMVRNDAKGVDFGIWKSIKPSQLICPCDLHVDRVGRKLGLIQRQQTDWKTAIELTENLKIFDAEDPVKYDFALFGLGVEEKF